ncbi:type II/IV secretion system protein [Rhizobacter sp. AJA081-3]|uniref:GspE/PulE family protein n=1 Tax=Rhizobacter sp. AJA081-3 TaxID=2753607 RepID=UPI001AE09C0C|nr:GspE/PulE family protein [Rhizobacter sp. AJA081-3]QTN25663.1 type II/IV secretion system protein [Rhizobacter sp. AJA081-3]
MSATLVSRVAQLRRQGNGDPLPALLGEAPDARALFDELGTALQMPVVRMQWLMSRQPRFDRLPFTECARRRCALVSELDGSDSAFLLIVTDPFDTDMVAWARTRFGAVDICLASPETFDAWLAHCETTLSAMSSLSVGAESGDAQREPTRGAEVLDLRQIGSDDSPAVRFVNSTLYDALKTGASDIHLESDPAGLGVKFRLDGVLTAMRRIDSPELAMQAISRIKVMSQLDIAERRVPQDGRLQIAYAGRAIDVRVSIMPSIHGEDAVLRILDRQHLAESLAGLTLAKLGFDEPTAVALRALCRKPHGMLLVTGPTGSGKTTTLYAAIAETHQSRDKIITIEDPVEYQLPGVLQIPVNERKGLTFARGLRSILRHDPDKILVGEIRDAETAQIAVQSALTGHLVFTTVHANTVFDVVGRFDQFGIDAYTFASAINGVLAQRLLRRLCPHCAVEHDLKAAEADVPDLGLALRRFTGTPTLKQARGCEHCRGTGYAGRFALGELLELTPALKALVAARAPQAQIQAEAERTGWQPLRQLALDAALRGQTTLEEVDRVAV